MVLAIPLYRPCNRAFAVQRDPYQSSGNTIVQLRGTSFSDSMNAPEIRCRKPHEAVVYGSADPLFTAEVSLCTLNRHVSEKELNLSQFAPPT